MEQKELTEYVCQYWHDFTYNVGGDDGCWVTEKTVSTKEDAEAWVYDAPDAEHTYFPIKISTDSIMKEQLKCLQDGRDSTIPKDAVIEAYKDVINKLEDDWRLIGCDAEGNLILPERNKTLLLLVRKNSGRLAFCTQIFCSWTENLFHDNDVLAWKYIQLPEWIPAEGFEKSYPSGTILNGREPTCEL